MMSVKVLAKIEGQGSNFNKGHCKCLTVEKNLQNPGHEAFICLYFC